jgi:hypothetical protein
MSQMVRAQLIFDRRSPASGLPAWRDADGDVLSIRLSAHVGAGEFLLPGDTAASRVEWSANAEAPAPVSFAQELEERLQLARERVEAEQVHLAEVDTVAAAYLGRSTLRLVK